MPVEFIRKINKDIVLGLWKITEDIECFLSELYLTEKEIEKLNSFVNENRKKHWLAYRILIDKMLNNNKHYEIEYDGFGKPFLKDSDNYISVTHTGKYAAVIISKILSVGVDIEKITSRILKVKNKFLNERELESPEKENNLECLYVYWCSKEAVYKLYGKRNLDFREDIFIKEFSISPKGKTKGIIKNEKIEKKVNLFFEFFDEHVLVYAIDWK